MSEKRYTREEVEKMVHDALAVKGWLPEQLAERRAECERVEKERDEQVKELAAQLRIPEHILEYGISGKPSISDTQSKSIRNETKEENQMSQIRKTSDQAFYDYFQDKTRARQRAKEERNLATGEEDINFDNLDSETQREIELWELAQRYGTDPMRLKAMNLSPAETEERLKLEGYKEIPEEKETPEVKENVEKESQDTEGTHLVADALSHWPFLTFRREPDKEAEGIKLETESGKSRVYGSGKGGEQG